MCTEKFTIKWKKLLKDSEIPRKAHPTDAGMDMRVRVEDGIGNDYPKGNSYPIEMYHDHDGLSSTYGVRIAPNETVIFRTGLACALPDGYVMHIYVRSSTGIKKNLVLANGTGVIDAHYRGEIYIALTNIGNTTQVICDNDRVAQAEIVEVLDYDNVEVEELDSTDRGVGGIGSTGR